MKSVIRIGILILICTILLCGCSGTGDSSNPIVPDENISQTGLTGEVEARETTNDNGHYLFLYNMIYVDPDNPDGPIVEVVPVRLGELHLNILKFLEVGPCTDCFKIVGFNFPEPGVLDVDIEITHPFGDLKFTIFDVRGIMMFNASHVFPASGLTMSDSNLGDGELLNAEGYTQLYNGSTLGAAGDFFTYFKGKFATDTIPDADLNGFLRHITDHPSNTRNALYPADSVIQTYSLGLPSGEFVLGYAVDASWDIPDADPVFDPMTDFPVTANCIEPWKIEIAEEPVGVGLTDVGGETKLILDVYDWQGKGSHAEPLIECPELFDGTQEAAFVSPGDGYSTYEITIGNDKLAAVGNYLCLVSVEDNANELSPEYIVMIAYQNRLLTVNEDVLENPVAVATADPNPQIAGQPVHFSGLDSYDPDGGDIQLYEWDWNNDGSYDFTGSEADNTWTAEGTYYVQLKVTDDEGETDLLDEPLEIVILSEITVLSPNGGEVWKYGTDQTIEWTASGVVGTLIIDYSKDNFVSDINNIAIGEDDDGNFVWTEIPKDPSSTVRVRVSSTDYPSLYDVSDADFSIVGDGWARTWGGISWDAGFGVAVDGSGSIYVTGWFEYTVDFDPGPEVDEHSSNGGYDVFLSKYDSEGDFQWARTWGGIEGDLGYGVAVDGSGSVYVTGLFEGTVDFDPGPGVDEHSSNGWEDVFLSKFDSEGDFQWAHTWGGGWSSGDGSSGVAVDSSGHVYVTGWFGDTVDFDPGPGVDEHSSNGSEDVFLSKFDSESNFQWAHTWGGDWISGDVGSGVAVDSSGHVYVSGWFGGTVDFDPGPGVDEHISIGWWYVFVSKFDSEGGFQWARTWGNVDMDEGNEVAVDGSGSVYVTGRYMGTVDFDPGPGVDEHSSNGNRDVFVSKLNSEGDFQWAQTWGGVSWDSGFGVAVDGSGSFYVTGWFGGTVDFDPGPEVDEHGSNGSDDVFLSKFDSEGNFRWARTWGGAGGERAYRVIADGLGSIYVTGSFAGTVDFDPGLEVDEHSSNGELDAFLSRFNSDGNW